MTPISTPKFVRTWYEESNPRGRDLYVSGEQRAESGEQRCGERRAEKM